MKKLFEKRHFEFIAEHVAPLLGTPQDIEELADAFEDTNADFKRGKFVMKAIKNWEDKHLTAYEATIIDDQIPY